MRDKIVRGLRKGRLVSIVIAGAGHAGGSVAAFLRQYGYKGLVTLVGEEPVAPYQRPPLSKAWLKGATGGTDLALRPESFYAANGIELRLDVAVVSIDREKRAVSLETGEALSYDRLVLALGSRARRLEIPGLDLGGIFELRTVADADRLKAMLAADKRLVVIGGGYIGLEVAASARSMDVSTSVIEREPRLLCRVASPLVSEFFREYHLSRGVELEFGTRVTALEGDNGRIACVRLSDGRRISCDSVLIGIGAVANDDLARAAGIDCLDGIVVDDRARTSDAHIYAIGDCTHRPLWPYERSCRLESVANAVEQAKQAASDICGRKMPPPEVPWFWSDQFDLRLQIAGLPFDVTDVVVRGDFAAAQFAVFHLGVDGRLQALEAINSPAEFMFGRMMIAKRVVIDRDAIRDVSRPIRQIATI